MTLFFSTLYSLLILTLLSGVFFATRRRKIIPEPNSGKVFISVLIAARNEENNIENCLNALRNQDYPPEMFEVIVVDDRSEDTTMEKASSISKLVHGWKTIHISNVPDGWSPKKYALSEGMKIVDEKSEILAFTDADCIPSRRWLKGIAMTMEENTGIVIGDSPIFDQNRQRFIGFEPLALFSYLESLALGAVAYGSAGLGYPVTCSGRNLAIRRIVMEETGGYSDISHFVSGDDDLLLQKVRDDSPWKTKTIAEKEATVWTPPPLSWNALFQARLRHASKTMDYSFSTTLLLISLYLMHFLPAAAFIHFVITGNINAITTVFLPLKIVVDGFLLFFFTSRRSLPKVALLFIPVVEIFYLFYVTFLPPVSLIKGFTWKGTKYGSGVLKRQE